MKYKYKSLILYILYINIRFLYTIPNIYFYKNLIEYRNSINQNKYYTVAHFSKWEQ